MSNIVPLVKTDRRDVLVENFRRYLLQTDRSNSARHYEADVRAFLDWLERRSIDARSATPLDIAEYRSHLQSTGRKPATVNGHLVSLKIFYDWLAKQKLIPDNPAEDIKPIASQELTTKWLSRQEQAALMRAVREGRNPRDEAMITLLLHTGLRVGELVNLEREDIYIGERSGKVTVRQGKGNKYREIPLNKTVRRALSRWLEINPEGPLFPNRYGKPMTARAVHKIIAEYAYRAKLKDVSPHTLRHTFCKNLIDVGIPVDQVAVMAGHSRLDVTRRYTAPSMQDLQAAVERIVLLLP